MHVILPFLKKFNFLGGILSYTIYLIFGLIFNFSQLTNFIYEIRIVDCINIYVIG